MKKLSQIRKVSITVLMVSLLLFMNLSQTYACTSENVEELQLNYTQLYYEGVSISQEDTSIFTVLNVRDEFRNMSIAFDYVGEMENLELFERATYYYDYQYNVLKIDVDGVEWYNDLNL